MAARMAVSYKDVLKAYDRVAGHIHKTPVVTSHTVDSIVGRKVFFKCENLQKTGSFKVRGALNAILSLKETRPDVQGIVTHSSGNHGQAVAWASWIAGLPCVVVVPNNTPKVKSDAIQGYGAELIFCEQSPTSRFETCQRIADEKQYNIVPPYDDYTVIAGQGTMAHELLQEVPDLDAILVPISGGGMTSGIATAAKGINPNIKIFGCEPQGKNLEPCLKSGERLWLNPPQFVDTIAEGIRTQQCGHLTFPILCDLIEKDVFTVTDAEMIQAMKFSFQRMKLVIEASAGASLAAVMSEKMRKMEPSLRKIGVILCGGNVDVENLPW